MNKIYDEITGEVIENPDLTVGKLYRVDIIVGYEPAKVVVMEGTITSETPDGLKEYIPEKDIVETVDRYHKYTIDELIQQQKEKQDRKVIQLDDNEKLKLLLKSFPVVGYPIDEDPGVGYKWTPAFDKEKGFIWQPEVDSDALETESQPLYWKNGMKVWKDYFYTDLNRNIKIARNTGIPKSFEDEEYFKSI